MNDLYSEIREHTLEDIKQVIDFYRLEIMDDQEMHDTIEGSLAETIADWAPADFQQIEITSSSMGDDLIISVCYTETTNGIDDQYMVVHNERDVFDNSGALLEAIMNSTIPYNDNDVDWTYTSSNFNMPFGDLELDFNEAEIEFIYDPRKPAEEDMITPTISRKKLHSTLNDILNGIPSETTFRLEDLSVEPEEEIVRSKPLIF